MAVLLTALVSACFDSTLKFEQRGSLASTDERNFQIPSDGFDKDPLPPEIENPGDLPLTITRVDPATGPAVGGSSVRVVGSAFSKGAKVFVGGRPVETADVTVSDSHEILIVTPAGDVGPADVTVELKGGETATLSDGYVYHGLDIAPAEGPTAGGTLVEVQVTGPDMEDVELRFDGALCTELEVVTPHRLRCRVPPGMQGPADLELTYSTGEDPLFAAGAFTYTNSVSSTKGGLSGGPIAGNLHVTVVDALMKLPLPNVWVVIGDDPSTTLRGQTDKNGQLTIAAADLVGPVTIVAALDCFETTTIVAFDAQDVVLALTSTGELRCIEDLNLDDLEGSGSGSSGGVTVSGSLISGELLFTGPAEFNANDWDIIPAPRDNEIRVAYVYATRPTVFSSEINPSRGNTSQRLVEGSAVRGTLGGFEYSIFTRPAGQAVYALAGLERTDTQKFTPYVMGIARNVVTSPGVETTDVNVGLTMLLDRSLQVQLSQSLKAPDKPPVEYRVSAYLDLGAEGVIMRKVGDVSLDTVVHPTADQPFLFFAQPALEGALSDLRYTILAGWYSGSYSDHPYTEALVEGVQQGAGTYSLSSLLGIPQAANPKRGARMPDDRVLSWNADGAVPDLYVVQLTLEDGTPLWKQIVPSDVRQVAIPDLSSLDGLSDLPTGFINWSVRGLRVRGFEYNRFSYTDLKSSNWTHDTVDDFVFEVP